MSMTARVPGASMVMETRPARELLRHQRELLPGGSISLINPLIYANAGALGDGAFRRQLFRVNVAGERAQPAVLLGRYGPETFIDGTGPFQVMTGGVMVAEHMTPWFAEQAEFLQSMRDGRPDATMIRMPCLLACHPGVWVWGHWLIDTLPKIVLAERAFPGRFSFVVPEYTTDPASPLYFVRCVLESLAAYGIGQDRLLRLRSGVLYCFDRLFDIVGVHGDAGVHLGALQALRVMPGAPASRGGQGLTAVMRGRDDSRQVANRGEIDAVLRRHGAGELDPHAASFLDQMRVFRDSAVIVGNMGSNLAYAIYAKPGAGMVTLAPCGWGDGYFADIFCRAGLCHADVRGRSLAPENIALAPHHVHPAHLDEAMDAMRAALGTGNDMAADSFVVDGRDVPRAVGDAVLRLAFGADGNAGRYQRGGFFAPEGARAWSNGPESRLLLEGFVPPGGDVWLEIIGVAFVRPPALPWRMLRVAVNGTMLAEFDVEREAHLHVRVPAALLASAATAEIAFYHGDCPSPHSFDGAGDRRPLGFMFESVALRRMVAYTNPG